MLLNIEALEVDQTGVKENAEITQQTINSIVSHTLYAHFLDE
jgi:hypothetical protein